MKRIFAVVAAAVFATATAASAAETITVAPFRNIELHGGGHVILKHGGAQRVTLLKGSTHFTTFRIESGDKLVIDTCNDRCPHIYDMDVEIVAPMLEGAGVSAGGEITAEGQFPSQASFDVGVKSGGSIDARAIPADVVMAAVKSGGDIQVHARNRLVAAVKSGGDITYSGNPTVISTIKSGGSVRRATDE